MSRAHYQSSFSHRGDEKLGKTEFRPALDLNSDSSVSLVSTQHRHALVRHPLSSQRKGATQGRANRKERRQAQWHKA